MLRRTDIAIGLAVAAALLVTTPAVQGQANFKAIDKLIKSSQATIGQVRSARLQVEETLGSYNAIINGEVPDNRKAYKQLSKNINPRAAARAKVRDRLAKMQENADALFADWEASLDEISSLDLRQRSQARMEETRARYDEIRVAAQEAGAEFDPFILSLRDQIVFLGNALNPAAIAELRPDAAKLNEQSEKVFATVDRAIETMTDATNQIKPQ